MSATGNQRGVVTAVIQARMGSSRLPGKVLMPLPFGSEKPLLGWIINGLRDCNLIDIIVIATSSNPENDPIRAFAAAGSIDCISGSESDVMSRFVEAVKLTGATQLVRITADNPFIDKVLLSHTIEVHQKELNDYTYTVNLPTGINMEIIRSAALLKAFNEPTLNNDDREHVTLYFPKDKAYKTQYYTVPDAGNFQQLRLTVDYPADFALASILASIANKENLNGMGLVEFVEKHHPWLWGINAGAYHKKIYDTLDDEVADAAEILGKLGLAKASDLLKQKRNESDPAKG